MSDPFDDRDEGMTFHDLAEIQSAERGSTALTRLPDQFYERATTYLRSLLAEMENLGSEGSKEIGDGYYRVSEEYRRSKDILDRIYSTRERKIVLAALNASRGINQKSEQMIHDEEELYFSLKVELENIRERILRYDRFHRKPSSIRPETGINTTTDDFLGPQIEPKVEKRAPTKAPMMDKALADLEELGSEVKEMDYKQEPEPTGPRETSPATLRDRDAPPVAIVRALKDIEPFVGPDNTTIALKEEDTASIPVDVATILVNGGMAKMVEGDE